MSRQKWMFYWSIQFYGNSVAKRFPFSSFWSVFFCCILLKFFILFNNLVVKWNLLFNFLRCSSFVNNSIARRCLNDWFMTVFSVLKIFFTNWALNIGGFVCWKVIFEEFAVDLAISISGTKNQYFFQGSFDSKTLTSPTVSRILEIFSRFLLI